jgi:RimJ/RimL family protein N-acetyltransferase
MQVYLETARVTLRRFTADDLEALVELDSDPAVMRYLGGEPTAREELRDVILPHWLAYYERGERYGFWAAEARESGEFLGWFHLRPLPSRGDGVPELGYRLRRAAWGQGYGTEVARALVDRAFHEFGAPRVFASTDVANVGSRRVMEKCGMTVVRHFVYDPNGYGTEPDAAADAADSVEYAIERGGWAG